MKRGEGARDGQGGWRENVIAKNWTRKADGWRRVRGGGGGQERAMEGGSREGKVEGCREAKGRQ
eukprot:365670-Chlamydomonas_euryale.AAC.6